jgi:hypothetical protein
MELINSELPNELLQDITINDLNSTITTNANENESKEIEFLFNDNNINKDNNNNNNDVAPNNNLNASQLISGENAGAMLNLIMPFILVLTLDKLIGKKCNTENFTLNGEEIKTIAPAIDKVLQTLNVNVTNPYSNLALVLGAVYLPKIASTFFEGVDTPQLNKAVNLVNKTERRGRHKLDCQCIKCINKRN